MTIAAPRALAALLIAVVSALSMALMTSAHAAAATASLTWSTSTPYVHPDMPLALAGTKAADASLEVEMRPPAGGGWQSLASACVGTAPGTTAWSCTVPAPGGERHKGDHHLRFTEVAADGQRTVQTGHIVVMPPAAKKPLQPVAPPPPPPPPVDPPVDPEPKPTFTAKPKPITITPPPAAAPTPAPAPAPTLAPRAAPLVIPPVQPAVIPAVQVERELPTFALPEPVRSVGERADAKVVDEPSRNDPATPSALQGLTTWQDLWANPLALGAAALMGLLYLLLVSVPAEILNNTLDANAHRWRRITAWAAPFTERLSSIGERLRAWNLAGPLVILATAVAFGFADPDFGFDATSLRLVLSLAIGLVFVVHIPNLITAAVMGKRFNIGSSIVTQPSALIFAVVGVIASRFLGFSPGLLVGLVIGLQLATEARASDQRRAIVVRISATYVIAVAAWAAYSWLEWALAGTPGQGGVVGVFLSETLAAIVVEGLTALVVALLPLTFLDGRTLLDQSRRMWAALAVPIAFTFCLIVLPSVEALDADAPLMVWVGVFLGFSATVVVVWLVFTMLDARDARRESEADGESADGELVRSSRES